MVPPYPYGRRKELQVAEFLGRRGYECGRSQGSRGAMDLIAKRGRRRYAIQVKATRSRSISMSRVSPDEFDALCDVAETYGLTPMVALVSGNYLWLVRASDDETVIEGQLLPLRYVYPHHT
jgi:Holliday junction resolvase